MTSPPSAPARVVLWATTLQANIWSLAKHLQSRPEAFEIVVVTEDVAGYLREPLARLRPPKFRLMEKNDPATLTYLSETFRPDVTVVDNHFPPKRLSPALLNVWHGFGWKGPEDREQFREVHKSIERLTGRAADVPNPLFRFINGGETNREYRTHVTGFAAENQVAAGQAFTDDIVQPGLTRDELLPLYPAAFAQPGRKVCLFAPTWHFGKIFSHWEATTGCDDIALLERIFRKLGELDCALILRMHDRKRFEPEYLSALEAAAARNPLVMVKYKDADRDNLLDLLLADVAISNYSSILTFFYGTGRPSIHIYPVNRDAEVSYYRVWKDGKVREKRAPDHAYIWSLPPEENGGLMVESFDALLSSIEHSLREPDVCRARSAEFIARHCAPYDGHTCERIAGELTRLAQTARTSPLPEARRGRLLQFWKR